MIDPLKFVETPIKETNGVEVHMHNTSHEIYREFI